MKNKSKVPGSLSAIFYFMFSRFTLQICIRRCRYLGLKFSNEFTRQNFQIVRILYSYELVVILAPIFNWKIFNFFSSFPFPMNISGRSCRIIYKSWKFSITAVYLLHYSVIVTLLALVCIQLDPQYIAVKGTQVICLFYFWLIKLRDIIIENGCIPCIKSQGTLKMNFLFHCDFLFS